jgi:transposase
MESTASYHIALFSYLTAKGYRVAIINPLLIANFAKLSLRKTKTDKKDAFTIAQFVLLRKETLVTGSPHLTELKDLSRRRERLVDEMTALKNDMKRILSVTFPELETITGIFTKSTLRLLTEFPSAHATAKAGYDAVAAIVTCRSRGRKSSASVPSRPQTSWCFNDDRDLLPVRAATVERGTLRVLSLFVIGLQPCTCRYEKDPQPTSAGTRSARAQRRMRRETCNM